jgi:NADH-quinone oxidoreductase subunit G
MSDAPEAPKKTTVTVNLDGVEIEAEPGQLVIAAAQDHGTFIPRFCWHERMGPVGMCRMCLVEIDTGRGPALTVSCMAPVSEGMKVVTDSEKVKKAQEGVLEFLLANHPLDCPVCDKGGECPLQDQAFSHGPGESRFVEEKRHYTKPIPISDLVVLDRERCVLCDRCTRFAREVAGDPLIHFTHRGNTTQVLTFPDEPFSSYFSGNTVQICPVGALTAKPYRFKARPWDLQSSESTCTVCSVGCRITVESSRNVVLRYQGVDSDAVNWGWLCDKGRFSHESLEAESRLRGPVVRRGAELVPTSWGAALAAAAELVRHAVDQAGAQSVAVLGGARGTNEDAYAWGKLAKAVIGTDHVDCQLGDGLPADVVLGLPRATIDEACAATTLVLLGGDLKEELPVLFLRVRDAAERRRMRILEFSATGSGLTPYAWRSLRHRPGEQGSLVRASSRAPILTGPRSVSSSPPGPWWWWSAGRRWRSRCRSPWTPSVRSAPVCRGPPSCPVCAGVPRAGCRTVVGLLPSRVTLEQVSDRAGVASVLATRPRREGCGRPPTGKHRLPGAARRRSLGRLPRRDLAARALAGAAPVVSIDTFLTEIHASLADVVLAAAGFGEKAGTTTNLEGRVTECGREGDAPRAPSRARLDDRRGARPPARARPRCRLADELTDARRAAGRVGGPPALIARGDRRRPTTVLLAGSSGRCPAHERAALAPVDSYGYRLVVGRTLYDAGRGGHACRRRWRRWPRRPPPRTSAPLDLDRLGVTARHREGHHPAAGRGPSRWSRPVRAATAPPGPRSTSPATAIATSSTRAARSPT